MKKSLSEIVRDAIKAHPKKLPLNERGELVPDPVPMAPPIGYQPQPDMMDMIRQQVGQIGFGGSSKSMVTSIL